MLDEIRVAIFDSGDMRVVRSDDDAKEMLARGGTIYAREDMERFLQLNARERRMLHRFKKRFGGSVEYRVSE
jgi:hypothetical protein